MASPTAENIQSIGRRIRSEKVRDRILRALRAAKEFHWPFGDTLLLDVTILTGTIFRDVFNLSNEG
jgi:hypothetical protein